MAITKKDIDNVSLNVVDEGYDPEEVDLLLERIAEEVDGFNRALVEAASRIEAAENRALAAEQQAAQSAHMASSVQSLEQAALASERQIAQVLIAAQKNADEVKDAAQKEYDQACRDAEQRARDIVRDALSEKQRIIDEVERLRESTERFRSEYIAILSRFTTDAKKVMPSLENSAPNVDAEKRATEEAVKVLREGDAAYAAPAPKPAQSSYKPVSAMPNTFARQPKFEAIPAGASNLQQKAPIPAAEPTFEFDDDLDIDIEEID